MKIEIVPEGNKTQKEGNDWNISSLFDMIFGGVGSIVEGLFESVVTAVETALSSAVRKLFAGVLAVLGLIFLLLGFAELLDFVYQVPGVGNIIVGVVVFVIATIVMLTANQRQR